MIYIGLILAVILLKKFIKDKKIYCITCGLLMFLLMLLRKPELGNGDTVSLYIPSFNRIMNFSFPAVITYYRNSDVFFYIITKIITLFCNNINIYFGICALPICFFASRLIYKYSEIPTLSFIMFISLNYYSWSYIVLRHSIALALVIWSYDFIKDKKPIKFVGCVVLAALFHKTAIIFLIAYPIANKVKLSSKTLNLIMIIAMPIILIGGKYVINIIMSVIGKGDYALYKTRQDVMGIGMFAVYYLVYIASCAFDFEMKTGKEIFYIVFVGVGLNLFTVHLAEFFRLGMFFNVFNIIMLPNAWNGLQENKYKKMIYISLMAVFTAYSLKSFNSLGLIPYKFF